MASACLAATLLAACGPANAGPPTINLYYAPEENLQKVVDRCNSESQGQYRIVYNKLQRDADGQREQLVRRLAAEDDGMDILGLDTTWTAEFAEAGWIEEWVGTNKAVASRGTLEGPLNSARYRGKLYAAPKNTNVQLLWYRSDLVPKPPKTWDEMIAMAKRLKAQGKPSTILIPGAQFEGYVVEYNTLVESAGGNIISDDGNRAEMDEGAVRALGALKKLADSGLTSPSLPNAQEDDIRLEFQRGDAVFQLNWPFVYPSMQEDVPELAKKVKWAPYPSVGQGNSGKSTIGGFNLAISRYSKHKPEAFQSALCLRNAANQKFSAINDGVPPSIESVYHEPEMAEEYPMRKMILDELKTPAIRPVTPAYQNVSTVLSTVLSPPSGIRPEATADHLREELQAALDSKGVMP